MPKEYTECVKSYIAKGRTKEYAQRRCAIAYYKRHGRTPKQDERATFSADELLLFDVIDAVNEAIGKGFI